MGDVGETFKMWNEVGQEKRRDNRETSRFLLEDKKIKFVNKNMGAHLIVTGKNGLIDFWPGTGKFIQRKPKRTGRGVFNLLKLCGLQGE